MIEATVLQQVIDASAEPVMIVRLDRTDWPVELANAAFTSVTAEDVVARPFAEVIEPIVGRDTALEMSESLRAGEETGFSVEVGATEYLVALKPIGQPNEDGPRYSALFWRLSAGGRALTGDTSQQALLRAKRRIRDLTRDDPVTGLLNERAFRDVLKHDWAVASREHSTLALVVFTLDDFDAYVDVFGQHASDTCLRRVGQAIRRCLRRASDVVARFGDARLVVLSHASDEVAVREFAERISSSVRDLGLHHPRSKSERFVTVSYEVVSETVEPGSRSADAFLDALLKSS
jgi:diguanylate cyclase (GGDEF)-like protein